MSPSYATKVSYLQTAHGTSPICAIFRPYSPKLVEVNFSEVELLLYGVLRRWDEKADLLRSTLWSATDSRALTPNRKEDRPHHGW
jgi:hypothetical protein